MASKEEIVEQLKAKAKEIGIKHGKAALTDINAEVIPLLLDLLAESIPGKIDDSVISVAKPIVKDALDSVIEGL